MSKKKIFKTESTPLPSLHENAPWWHYAIPLLLVSLTIATYYPSLSYKFLFDDLPSISKYFHLRHLSFTKLFFSGSRWISFWLNALLYRVNGFNPITYRTFAIGLHCLNGCLIFALLYTCCRRLKHSTFMQRNACMLATLTTALFLLHPVQTQTVSYVIQAELEGMALFCINLMGLLFIAYHDARKRIERYAYLVGLLGIALLATGTKEIAIIAPLFVLLLDWFFIAQGEWSSFKKRMFLHGIIASTVLCAYIYLLKPSFFGQIFGFTHTCKNNAGNIITEHAMQSITPWYYALTQGSVILHYIWIFFWPYHISVEYDWKLITSIMSFAFIQAALILLLMSYGIYRLLRTHRAHPLAFGLVWFFIALAPRASIVPSPELVVDYKTYIGSAGLLFVIALGMLIMAQYIATHIPRLQKVPARTAALFSFIVLLLASTSYRNTVWSSGKNFWGNIVYNAPSKARAHNNYGVELLEEQALWPEAIRYFQQAIALDATYADPWNNIAVAYGKQRNYNMAIDAIKHSIRINPHQAEAYNNLASFFFEQGDYDTSITYSKQALAIRPHYGKALFNIGRIYIKRNDPATAWQYLHDACFKGDLDNEIGFTAYAQVSTMVEKHTEAIEGYKKALQCNASNIETYLRLASAYYLAQDYKNAQRVYEFIITEKPQEWRAVFSLGELHLKQGFYAQALDCFKKVHATATPEAPYATLRMAQCYQAQGNNFQAERHLKLVANNRVLPENLRSMAREGMLALRA